MRGAVARKDEICGTNTRTVSSIHNRLSKVMISLAVRFLLVSKVAINVGNRVVLALSFGRNLDSRYVSSICAREELLINYSRY